MSHYKICRCPKCDRIMTNLGNITGVISLIYPAQWVEVFVCHTCRVKINITCRDNYQPQDFSYLDDYEEIKE